MSINKMTKKRKFIIAEMACSHEGEEKLAKKIIDGAAKANADAIQLQIWELKYMMTPQRSEFEWLKKIEFSHEEWSNIIKYSRSNYPNLEIWVCVYEHQSIEFIDSLNIDGYKLNSSDLSNPLVLEKVALSGKPINLSVGASTLDEIESALDLISNISKSAVILMYGFQNFPTNPESVHMLYMNTLKQKFNLPIGYQDHCDADTEAAFWMPAAAVGMGVEVLEKHITHDRNFKGVDHESALNPDEFIRFVEMVRILDKAQGSVRSRPFSEDEIKYREFQKKSIVAARDLPAGVELTEKDLAIMRAESLGLSPDKVEVIIGKFTQRDIPAYQALTKGDVR